MCESVHVCVSKQANKKVRTLKTFSKARRLSAKETRTNELSSGCYFIPNRENGGGGFPRGVCVWMEGTQTVALKAQEKPKK